MARQDEAEEEAPVRVGCLQDDRDRLRVNPANAADVLLMYPEPSAYHRTTREDRPTDVVADRTVGELEVTCSDRRPVAPASFGTDAVANREGLPRDDLTTGEVRPEGGVGHDLVGSCENSVV